MTEILRCVRRFGPVRVRLPRAILFLLVAIPGCTDRLPSQSSGGSESHDLAGPGITGRLLDALGEPVKGGTILACMRSVCLTTETSQDGVFSFLLEPPVQVALKTIPQVWGPTRGGVALCPVKTTEKRDQVDVGLLYVPTLPQGVLIGAEKIPRTLDVGDGLRLTLNPSHLSLPTGTPVVDIAARRVPLEQLCSEIKLESEEILAVYALHPFSGVSNSPIAVAAPLSLPDGTVVFFRTISEVTGEYSDPVQGHAKGPFVSTDPKQGILELSWLVLSRPQ